MSTENTLTSIGLGLRWDTQQASSGPHGYEGWVSLSVDLGPFSASVRRAWLHPDRMARELAEAARRAQRRVLRPAG